LADNQIGRVPFTVVGIMEAREERGVVTRTTSS
jgi:hypothetical protein